MQATEFYREKEIFAPVDLCRDNGLLKDESVGWSRKPLVNCNLSGRWPRKKKWNYWCITNADCLFSATISNLDYAGMVFVYFYDFKTQKFIEKTIITPFGKGCDMGDNFKESIRFSHPQMEVHMLENYNSTKIVTTSGDFGDEKLNSNFKVVYPKGYESLNVIIPWDYKTFQFTSKHEGLPVEGRLRIGDRDYVLNPEDTFACLDFGRGVWPRKSSWNWANAAGIVNGKMVGLNLGGKWTDGTGMTENAIVVGGRITKLSEDISFEYDEENYMKPWKIKTTLSDRVNLTFKPVYERKANTNMFLVKSMLHQMIGYFSGIIKPDQNEALTLDNIIGCAEDHFAQW